jgi:hypothetical protein
MELTHLSLSSYVVEYAGIVSLLLLWTMYGRKAKTVRPARIITPPPTIHPRGAQRHPVILPVEVSWELNDAKATTTNISVQGCRVKSDIAPPVGTYVSVKLYLEQGEECLAIDMAVVRWALGQDFGLEFLSWGSTARQRLQRFLQSLGAKKQTSSRRPQSHGRATD